MRPRAFLLLLGLLASPAQAADRPPLYGAEPPDLDARVEGLVAAYPDTISGRDGNDLVLRDGTRLPLSDGRTDKSFDTLLNRPDIGDMFAFRYPAGEPAAPPALNHDPGRIRVEALFRALYGDCRKGEVAGRLRTVKWLPRHGGGTVTLTQAQGAADALERVSRELDELPAAFVRYLVPIGGTYNCRAIAGTERMSMHGYGAAIDINIKHTTYWQWVKPGPDGTYRWSNQIPAEIVDIFEKHGFVWGGRWYHFDTMHFEYRPELALPAQ
ncbi:MAG TPA: M15 family peptidase [Rhizobiales bacterium]|nr:M15 family peptidase [Hyphomicrobiales bacterium]